ncbi:MAG TPA: MoaD/ThiS family protein [Thermoanaerobaculia bacterium]|nr:MoaD/ThiS family protein [Thermoanaerobaculia bacterium]
MTRPPAADTVDPITIPEKNRAANAAAITIFVPGLLRHDSGGKAELTVSAADVRTALGELEVRYPSLHRNLCDETGAVRRHVNLFVNSNNIRDLAGVESKLAAGDVLTILPAVSGG